MAIGIGVFAAALVEVTWWVQGSILGEKRRLWRSD
jgi:cation-transporting P-type ATPase E